VDDGIESKKAAVCTYLRTGFILKRAYPGTDGGDAREKQRPLILKRREGLM
jgi:hypothetical protein